MVDHYGRQVVEQSLLLPLSGLAAAEGVGGHVQSVQRKNYHRVQLHPRKCRKVKAFQVNAQNLITAEQITRCSTSIVVPIEN